MKVFLLRHADDPHDIIGGWSDIGLTDFGKQQAMEIVDFFKKNQDSLQINHIISSDLVRAKETISATAQALGLDVEINEDWNGLNQGEFNGCSSEQAKALYPYLNLWAMDYDETFPKGESPKLLYNRVINAWNDLFSKYNDNDNILICTHGVNMVILETYLKKQVWNHREKRNFYPCVLMKIDTVAKKINMQRLTDIPTDY